MKKLLAGILAATMMLSLCACGAKTETPASKTETAQTETKTETTEATTESGATNIVVYRACFNNGNPDSAKTKEIELSLIHI